MDTLRKEANKKKISKSDRPLMIYLAIALGIVISLLLRLLDKDLSENILSEIIGVTFTMFVIEALLVRTKTKRWHVVQEDIDYLIARTINRIRDGIATRIFSFKPVFDKKLPEDEVLPIIRAQRENFLNDLDSNTAELLVDKIDREFFTEDNYDYFDEKAEDIWKLINMKYSEYLSPSLVALLIELHTNLIDTCAHIRLYGKSERFPDEKEYYYEAGLKGVAGNMKEIIRIVIKLKEEGYSETARKLEN